MKITVTKEIEMRLDVDVEDNGDGGVVFTVYNEETNEIGQIGGITSDGVIYLDKREIEEVGLIAS